MWYYNKGPGVQELFTSLIQHNPESVFINILEKEGENTCQVILSKDILKKNTHLYNITHLIYISIYLKFLLILPMTY